MIKSVVIEGEDFPVIQDAYHIRDLVFTQEQGYPAEIDVDDYDKIAWHCVLYDGKAPIATGRLIPKGDIGKIGRVAVLKSYRGQNLGLQLMQALMAQAEQLPFTKIELSAQAYAQVFYEKLGFSVVGDIYLEDGEPHIHMEKVLL
ncbi:GNAT family N-acetyltransferase [Wohlfahrtiimonas larvae]|uniref:GNAT family N-acetyltransferase n=1 Tax=Wohlfahrtiimonas larvae TaxID=1157986 RepID=A0ABP9MB76_9GAMM|nr:GNAT family N-acetyltransferase [Wohlfahrtiimonas larvae]